MCAWRPRFVPPNFPSDTTCSFMLHQGHEPPFESYSCNAATMRATLGSLHASRQRIPCCCPELISPPLHRQPLLHQKPGPEQPFVESCINLLLGTASCLMTLAPSSLYTCHILDPVISLRSRAILSNPDLHWNTPLSALMLNDFWGTPLSHSGSHKSYRPVTVLSFRLNYYWHQLRPMGYHLTNLVLHAITAALFTRFAGQLFRAQTRPTLVAGLLFATHPIHCEAVSSVVGRADTGAGLFFLLSLLSYIRFCDRSRQSEESGGRAHLYLSLGFAGLAMLTKETGISECCLCSTQVLA